MTMRVESNKEGKQQEQRWKMQRERRETSDDYK